MSQERMQVEAATVVVLEAEEPVCITVNLKKLKGQICIGKSCECNNAEDVLN